jgi:hypothetical protein
MDLLHDFHHDDIIRGAIEAAVIREKKCRTPELNPNSYIYVCSLSLQRMESTIQSLERRGNPVFVLSQANLTLLAPGWTRTLTIDNLPIVEPSMAEQDYRFQRNYRALFKAGDSWETKVSIISWETIDWVLKDYGPSREEIEPWDATYWRILRQWTSKPPPVVKLDPRFCDCPRRHKWDSNATIDSVEYNWPLFPEKKEHLKNVMTLIIDSGGSTRSVRIQFVIEPLFFAKPLLSGASLFIFGLMLTYARKDRQGILELCRILNFGFF